MKWSLGQIYHFAFVAFAVVDKYVTGVGDIGWGCSCVSVFVVVAVMVIIIPAVGGTDTMIGVDPIFVIAINVLCITDVMVSVVMTGAVVDAVVIGSASV